MKTIRPNQSYVYQLSSIKLFIAIVALLATLTSCNEDELFPPTAAFEKPEKANEGEEVQFQNTSLLGNEYFWLFGDGNFSNEENPVHTYNQPGYHEIVLIAKNADGADTTSAEIFIEEVLEDCEIIHTAKPEGYLTDHVFCDYTKMDEIKYATEVSDNILMFYEPQNADFSKPLVILSPGGAWKNWSRTWELEQICIELALKGYAVARVHYSIIEDGTNPDADIWAKSSIDQRNAIRYFRKNAEQYNIDPNNIFIGGWSTGSMISMTNGLIDDEDIAQLENESFKTQIQTAFEKYEDYNVYTEESYAVNGIIMMFGWFIDVNIFDANDTPLMLINHAHATMGSGILTWGTFDFGGDTYYGFDIARDKAIEAGYVEGETLSYIKMDGAVNMSEFPSVEAMNLENINAINDFLIANLK